MAIIDVVKCELQGSDWIVWKVPTTDLKLGTQLIVNEGQSALFVKDGKICDLFESGRYTLSTSNIPLLNKIINMPFGSNLPFTAEVWFFSKLIKRDQKWGTPNPISILDYGSGMSIDTRSFGNWGYKLINIMAFYQKFIGANVNFEANELKRQFDSLLLQKFTVGLVKSIEDRKLSVNSLMAHLDSIVDIVMDSITLEFALYGIEIINFNISSLTFDPAQLEKIRSVEFEVMRANKLDQLNLGNGYKTVRNLDIMEDSANNPNSVVANSISAGMGIATGIGMAQAVNETMQLNTTSSKKENEGIEERLLKLKKLFEASLISEDEYKAKRLDIISEL